MSIIYTTLKSKGLLTILKLLTKYTSVYIHFFTVLDDSKTFFTASLILYSLQTFCILTAADLFAQNIFLPMHALQIACTFTAATFISLNSFLCVYARHVACAFLTKAEMSLALVCSKCSNWEQKEENVKNCL